ncbi:cytochrome-c peroxidase [Singulisphaera acidiphila]|uniref:Methylamine utilization protein MauG n=1 Tax=Singulisphaera acidiphila (strain ATCC BAA-1392 / DSM 18658 / VKM B-2454 / MOB10) TaxID=886293 RepID=L0DK53_SINAD|nr:cytochrome c peroxidase [Singulisphaera acidiphila]AGA29220.1 cytochrome c peroxidase [Singulisphaera acidiphila DSM 18658]
MLARFGSVTRLALAAALLTLGGCGGTGTEKEEAASAPSPSGALDAAAAKATDTNSADLPAKLVTPDRAVDPKKLVDVVEQEVKGGENASPSPESILWLPTDQAKVKDEPLTVQVPKGLSPLILNVNVPASNPLTKAKFELGKQLYFDPRVSLDGTISCATCHNPEKGWTDQLKFSIGIDGQTGGRNAPTVVNTVYGKTMFWDGRAPSLEGQAQGPIQNPIEMGKQSYEDIVKRLRTIPSYKEQFATVFGSDVTLDGMAKAIATFERVAALSGNSRYDKYNSGDDLAALSESEKRGMVLFGLRLRSEDEFKPNVTLKKADCTSCHTGSNFTNEQFHNIGVGWNTEKNDFADYGRFVISPIGSKNNAELGAFKTPTVREIEKTGPYMHDGSMKTLEEVVEHYNKGGNPNPALDKDIKKLNLTDSEKADVVAFLKALTGEEIKVALPTLPPGADGKTPDPQAALTPPPLKTVSNVFHPDVQQ